MLAAGSRLMPGLGIELVDVRIKRINYIASVREQVESRMISERQSIAARFRSEGQGRSQEILGEMERELRRIRSESERKAQEIIGQGGCRSYTESTARPLAQIRHFMRSLGPWRAMGRWARTPR